MFFGFVGTFQVIFGHLTWFFGMFWSFMFFSFLVFGFLVFWFFILLKQGFEHKTPFFVVVVFDFLFYSNYFQIFVIERE